MFDNQPAHVYYVEWGAFKRMFVITDVPLSHKRLREYERERKRVTYGVKSAKESLDEVLERMRNDGGAFG